MDIINVWAYLQQKDFDHPFPSHLLTNKQWLTDFKILYMSSTFTSIAMPFMKSISYKSVIINFSILWNVWFSKIFCKIHQSNGFFAFYMSFFIKTWHFSLLLLFLCFERRTCFLFSKIIIIAIFTASITSAPLTC